MEFFYKFIAKMKNFCGGKGLSFSGCEAWAQTFSGTELLIMLVVTLVVVFIIFRIFNWIIGDFQLW